MKHLQIGEVWQLNMQTTYLLKNSCGGIYYYGTEKESAGESQRLKKTISMTIGTVVGVGLFTCASAQIGLVGSWIIGAAFIALLISICPCLIYGEMSAALPCAGGTYNYSKRGLNRIWANLSGRHYLIL